MNDYKPTPGNCYQDCVTLIERGLVPAGALLCHGYPALTMADGDTPAGTRYGHAWVEAVTSGAPCIMCYDHMHHLKPTPRGFYYEVGDVDPTWVRRYTLEEAYVTMLAFGHYGPWHAGPGMPLPWDGK